MRPPGLLTRLAGGCHSSLTAHDLYLRALALSYQFTPESLGKAVAVLRKAMEIDSSYALSAALSAFCFSWWHAETRAERPQVGG